MFSERSVVSHPLVVVQSVRAEHRKSLSRACVDQSPAAHDPASPHQKGLSPLQQTLRNRVPVDLIFRIVDLGRVLHKVLQAKSSQPPTSSTATYFWNP